MKGKSKLLVAAVALSFIITSVGLVAYDADAAGEGGVIMDGTEYNTIQDAVDKIENNGSGNITLMGDTALDKTIIIKNNTSVNLNLGGFTLTGPSSDYLIKFGSYEGNTKIIDKYTKTDIDNLKNESFENDGTLSIDGGKIVAYKFILNYFGKVELGADCTITASSNSNTRYMTLYGGSADINGSTMSGAEIGFVLFNSFYSACSGENSVANYDSSNNNSPIVTINSGSISCGDQAITGNNLLSAGTKITISNSTLSSEGVTMYLPMQASTTIVDSTIVGATAIEMKMGSISIDGSTQIVTNKDRSNNDINVGTSDYCSGLLVVAHKYGHYGGQARFTLDDSDKPINNKDSTIIKVDIYGGSFISNYATSKAFVVYNAGDNDISSEINIHGGLFESFELTSKNADNEVEVVASEGAVIPYFVPDSGFVFTNEGFMIVENESELKGAIGNPVVLDDMTLTEEYVLNGILAIAPGVLFNGTVMTDVDGTVSKFIAKDLLVGDNGIFLSKGSIIVNGDIRSGDVTLDGDAEISGTVGPDIVLTIMPTATVTVPEGKTLEISGTVTGGAIQNSGKVIINEGSNVSTEIVGGTIVEGNTPSIPDDDDELPFIPPQSNDDGADTTTYVAVAAAAAVVAILAVLAVGISKGKL